MTYAELDGESTSLRHALLIAGVRKHEPVVVFSSDREFMIKALLGVLKAGAAFVLISGEIPVERINRMLDQCGKAWALIGPDAIDKFKQVSTSDRIARVKLGPEASAGRARRVEVRKDQTIDPDGLGYIVFTSGSTGLPKPIAGRLRAIDHFIRWEIKHLDLSHSVRGSQLISPMFDAFLRDVFVPLCVGGTICIPPHYDILADGAVLAQWLNSQRVSLIHSTPSVFRLLLDLPADRARVPTLRHVLLSGEAIRPADVGKWNLIFGRQARLTNLYGPSETTMTKLFYTVQPSDEGKQLIPIGKPIEGARAAIVNETGCMAAPGMLGEIYIRTPYRALGYYNRPDLTNLSFVRNPLSTDASDIVYKTGDIGRLLESGDLALVGRRDRQVKVRGVRIELDEVELILNSCPAVHHAIVIPLQDKDGNTYLCAYSVLRAGAMGREVQEFMSRQLPTYMVPAAYVELDRLPVTTNGKIDRQGLPEPDRSSSFDKIQTDPLVEMLCHIWENVLNVEEIRPGDNFFARGGHSLLVAQIVSRIRQSFNVELPLRSLFEAPTVSALAAKVRESGEISTRGREIVPQPHNGIVPVSLAQQGLWLAEMVDPDGSTYNMCAAIELCGPLNQDEVRKAFEAIARRHEVLRARFSIGTDGPIQQIEPEPNITFIRNDLSRLERDDRNENLISLMEAEAGQAFNLERGPLIRLRLLSVGAETNILLVTVHHLVSDGWSMHVINREFEALYRAQMEGKRPQLPELKLQYSDYARWQREQLSSGVLEEQKEYWRRHLAGLPSLPCRTDFARPSVKNHRGQVVAFELDRGSTDAMSKLAREETVTLFMVIVACWQLTLSAHSGQRDIPIGTVLANRRHVEVEPLIGCFVNTVVIRTPMCAKGTFRELLHDVCRTTLAAHDNQDVTFETVVRDLQPKRDLGEGPLFQTMVVFHETARDLVRLPGIKVRLLPIKHVSVKADIDLHIQANHEAISGSLVYDPELFCYETIQTLSSMLQTLLRNTCLHPLMRIEELITDCKAHS